MAKNEWVGRLIPANAIVPGYADTVTGTQPYFYISSYKGKYRVGEQGGTPPFNAYRRGRAEDSQAYNAKKFQLICAGSDAIFGEGGYYDAESETVSTPADADNITNFQGGELVP